MLIWRPELVFVVAVVTIVVDVVDVIGVDSSSDSVFQRGGCGCGSSMLSSSRKAGFNLSIEIFCLPWCELTVKCLNWHSINLYGLSYTFFSGGGKNLLETPSNRKPDSIVGLSLGTWSPRAYPPRCTYVLCPETVVKCYIRAQHSAGCYQAHNCLKIHIYINIQDGSHYINCVVTVWSIMVWGYTKVAPSNLIGFPSSSTINCKKQQKINITANILDLMIQ